MITEAQVMEALKPIEDPELHLGIVDLGLIYEVKSEPAAEGDGEQLILRMTFTSPFCPYGPMLKAQVHQALTKLPGVKQARVDIIFTPPWDPRTMASEDAKIALGLGWDEDEPTGPGSEIENQR
jgi:metal-sulfur cluster biosynthetic enzyme